MMPADQQTNKKNRTPYIYIGVQQKENKENK